MLQYIVEEGTSANCKVQYMYIYADPICELVNINMSYKHHTGKYINILIILLYRIPDQSIASGVKYVVPLRSSISLLYMLTLMCYRLWITM